MRRLTRLEYPASGLAARTGNMQTLSIVNIRCPMWKTGFGGAARVQGFPRHLSVHAGGIVIGDKPLSHYTPRQNAPIGVPITHIDMFSAEDIKLIKLDVLATRGLGTYWDTMDLVEKRHGSRPPVEDERSHLRMNQLRTHSHRQNERMFLY